MRNGRNPNIRTRQRRPGASSAPRAQPWSSNTALPAPRGSQSAQKNYERYLVLAEAAALAGDSIGAENYYQHAEHYFRVMSPNPGAT
jgi:hypothetical protein